MKLLEMTPHQKKKDCFSLLFDDGTRRNCYAKVALAFSLYPGKELDAESYLAFLEAADAERIRQRAARLVSGRAMSKGELVKKLVEKGEAEEQAEEAAHWLFEIGALNDEEYARTLVARYAARGYGPNRIKQEFYHRHIPRELWAELLEGLDSQEEAIDRFILSKLRGEIPDRKEERRVADALSRRGHDWDEIRAAMRRYLENCEAEEG